MKIEDIVNRIVAYNNIYRDNSKSPMEKLCALWNIGDELKKNGVKKPHKYGWDIQRATKGIIKRPTIFRGFKVRLIWTSIEKLKEVLGEIKGLSNFIEMLPLVDPEQSSKYNVPSEIISQIYKRACTDSPQNFKTYINNVKTSYATGRLAQKVDRFRHLTELDQYVRIFSSVYKRLDTILKANTLELRDEFRNSVPLAMRAALSNMCISLTTKTNYRYYRKTSEKVLSSDQDINILFEYFQSILNSKADTERARIRKLISSDHFARLSDMLTSVGDEAKVQDYKMRENMSLDI